MVTRSILRPVLRPLPLLLMDDGPPFPRSLFAAGEQGIWLDPSDFSTLFQDAAGTTPVTAVGQPVGLALDKRLGMVLGAELKSTGAIGLVGSATAATYNTTTGAGSVTRVNAANQSFVTFAVPTAKFYKMTISAAGADIYVNYGDYSIIPWATIAAGTSSTILIPVLAGYTSLTIRCASAGTATFAVNSVREIAGNHAYQTTSASRPTLQQDSNGLYYLSFDGTDDCMATPSIDFTGTDKVTVWTGVRKLSDAALGIICELSASAGANNGVFYLAASASAGANYQLLSKGTVLAAATPSGIAAPITNVLTGICAISDDLCTVRVNGVATSAATDQGTGNFGNYPLYIGRRGGITLPFNGRIYQLIIRGAASNAGQIAATEAWVNSKTRAY